MNRTNRILIVDDEESIRFSLAKYLKDAGYAPHPVANLCDAQQKIKSESFEIAIVDRILANGRNGLELLADLRRNQPFCQTILISGYPSFESAAEAISLCVFAYLAKPVRKHEILPVVKRASDRFHSLRTVSVRERMMSLLFDAGRDAVAVYDLTGTAVFINPAFSKLFGYTRMDVVENRLPALPESERQRFDAGIEPEPHEVVRTTKDGRHLKVSVMMAPIPEYDNLPGHIMAIYREPMTEGIPGPTEDRDMLFGSIAHDFNNIITTILGNSELCEMYLEDRAPENIGNCLKAIADAGKRARQLTGKILARRSPARDLQQPVVLGDLLEETLGLLKPVIPDNITVDYLRKAGTAIVAGDACQLQRVLINLCMNAIQAMKPDGGALTITVNRNDPEGIETGETQRGVHLTIGDTGCGMDPEIRERIFEPFFTTKAPGEGTGLGLFLAREIIRDMGGTLTVDTKPGKGSFFTIHLPDYIEAIGRVSEKTAISV